MRCKYTATANHNGVYIDMFCNSEATTMDGYCKKHKQRLKNRAKAKRKKFKEKSKQY